MNKLAIIAKRYSYVATAALLTLAMAAPALITGSASAGQLTDRSVEISSSMVNESATYKFTFTPADITSLEAVVIEFCDDPLPGTTCDAAAGLTVGSTIVDAVTGSGTEANWSASAAATELTLTATTPQTVSSAAAIVFEISGFTNPSSEGSVYPRMFLYNDDTIAANYDDVAPGAYVDNGSVAFAIAETIDVTAVVRETLTFCVSAADLTAADCGSATTPSVELGALNGDVYVIDETQAWTGNVYYQLTTNASYGTTLSLAGDSTLTSGSNSIAALTVAGDLGSGESGFGAQVPVPGVVAAAEDGVNLTATGNLPTATNYAMPATVADPYGVSFASASGAVRSADGQLTFGARAAANTPAGIYTASYGVIATPSY